MRVKRAKQFAEIDKRNETETNLESLQLLVNTVIAQVLCSRQPTTQCPVSRLTKPLQLSLSRESTQTVMTMDLCRGSELPSWGCFAQKPSKKSTEGQAEREGLPEV
jgi:hypothetical protein